MEVSVKWLYLACRGPSIARDDFVKEWRGHARLASRFPDIVRCFEASIYCLLDANGGDFSAVGIITLRDETAIGTALAHPDAIATIHPDEQRVFGDLIARLSMGAEEEALLAGPVGEQACLAFVRCRADRDDRYSLSDIRTAMAGPLERRTGGVSRCILNRIVPNLFVSTHRYDAVIELYGSDASQLCETVAPVLELPCVDPSASLRVQGRIVMNWAASPSA
jgi:hypothetical protein